MKKQTDTTPHIRKPNLKAQIRNVLLSIAADPDIDAQYRLEALQRLNELRTEHSRGSRNPK